MTKKNNEHRESFLVKGYIVLFFLLGIGIWYSVNLSVEGQKAIIDNDLDQKINDILFESGFKQEDIILQYAKEKNSKNIQWLEYYKTIRLEDKSQLEHVEPLFRQAARAAKLGLERKNYADKVIYKFYSENRGVYSNITFVSNDKKEQKSQSPAENKTRRKKNK
ncbi:MAG: hypothetical protein LBQ37_00690 [Elusimicrobiota bacterium]|jgi:hypothetical protein|nr:hypothetical protein [Elusimicrobiota bacterium]